MGQTIPSFENNIFWNVLQSLENFIDLHLVTTEPLKSPRHYRDQKIQEHFFISCSNNFIIPFDMLTHSFAMHPFSTP